MQMLQNDIHVDGERENLGAPRSALVDAL